MNEETLTQDETGIIWIALKLNGDLRPPRHNLETLSGPQVLPNHMGHEIMPVKNGQHVSVADVQTKEGRKTRIRKEN